MIPSHYGRSSRISCPLPKPLSEHGTPPRRYTNRDSPTMGPIYATRPNLTAGAFAELSRTSEYYWPTAIYEMAHETVHLLNPVPGSGNYLGDGIAVAFSVYAQMLFGLQPQPIGLASYRRALELVCRLPNGPLEAARQVRAAVGALSQVTAQHLEDLFPDVDRETLSNLAAPFVRTANVSLEGSS